jgi:hypothetical protein
MISAQSGNGHCVTLAQQLLSGQSRTLVLNPEPLDYISEFDDMVVCNHWTLFSGLHGNQIEIFADVFDVVRELAQLIGSQIKFNGICAP